TITKSETSGTTTVTLGFNNNGTVLAQSGTIVFEDGATLNGGNYLAGSGAGIDFDGNIALTGPITNLVLSGVTVTGLSNLVTTASLTNCNFSDQETIVGTISLSGGSLSGSLTVASNGVLNLSGGWTVYGPLTNNGTVNWQGGSLTVNYNPSEGAYGVVWNQMGAQWNILCDQSLTYNNVY